MRSRTSKFIAAAVVLAASSASQAAIITLGTPTTGGGTVPTIEVAGGGAFSVNIYARAQGSGFVGGMSVGVFASSVPSWAGGVISAASAASFSASNAITAPGPTLAFSYQSDIATVFNLSRGTINQTVAAGTTIAPLIANVGGAANSSGTNRPTSAAHTLVGTLNLSVLSTPGTYYLYLARTGSGISESPTFSVGQPSVLPTSITSATWSGNSAVLGAGDLPIASTGTGSIANTTSAQADAIIVVPQPAPTGPTLAITSGLVGSPTGSVSVAGSALAGYALTAIPTPAATSGVYNISFGGGAPGAVITAYTLGGTNEATTVATLGLLPVVGSNLAGLLAGYEYYKIDTASGSTYNLAYNMGNTGTTVTGLAVIPEPTSAAILGLAGLPLLSRRGRRA